MLERSAGYQAGQSLILFAFPICLPPVRILLGNYVKHIAFLEAHAQLSARYVRIFLRIVIEVRSYMNLNCERDALYHCEQHITRNESGIPPVNVELHGRNCTRACININVSCFTRSKEEMSYVWNARFCTLACVNSAVVRLRAPRAANVGRGSVGGKVA